MHDTWSSGPTDAADSGTWTRPDPGVTQARLVVAGAAGYGTSQGFGCIVEDTIVVDGLTSLVAVAGDILGGAGDIVTPGAPAHAGNGGKAARIGTDYIAGGGTVAGYRYSHPSLPSGVIPGSNAGKPGEAAHDGWGGGGVGGNAQEYPGYLTGNAGLNYSPGTGGAGKRDAPSGSISTLGGGGGYGGGAGGITFSTSGGGGPDVAMLPGLGGGSKGGTWAGWNQTTDCYVKIFYAGKPGKPTLTAPSGGVELRADEPIGFRWAHTPASDDPEDVQSGWLLEYQLKGSGSWASISGTGVRQDYVMPAGTLAGGIYEWRISTRSDQRWSDPSDIAEFQAVARSLPPTVFTPTALGTYGWDAVDVSWAADQAAWQARIVGIAEDGTPDESMVFDDSGQTFGQQKSHHFDASVTNRDVFVQVAVRGVVGDWSDWTSVRITLSDPAPPDPVAVLAAGATDLAVTVDNPAETGGEPVVTGNDIYLLEDGVPLGRVGRVGRGGTWVYRYPRSGVHYAARVYSTIDGSPAVGDSGEVT